jgi:hypothetical protein
MEALLAAFMESLKSAATEGAMAEVGASAAAPASIGSSIGNMVNQQINPTVEAFKGITNPNATMGDMANSAFKYSFNPKEDEKSLMLPQAGMAYGGMANNYVGGIPSLLQNTGSGILPYIGSR